jgi:TMEM175 potassium channel family protein
VSADKPAVAGEPEPELPDSRDQALLPSEGERHLAGGLYPLAKMGYIEYDRVLFFSDAIFAIAITILAVNLHVPTGGGNNLSQEISKASSSLTGFGISFAAIALFWVGHHGMFRHITAFDRPLILLNLLFLGTIAFLPYPTELLSQAHSGSAATVFYSVCISAAGLTELAAWLYATRADSGLSAGSARAIRLYIALRTAVAPVVFLASIPVAIAAPKIAPFTWLSIIVLDAAVSRFAARS